MAETEIEIEKIIELGKSLPNNQDFGKKFRSLYGINEITRSIPNDFELGNELRRIIQKKSK
jgi:hypothetical protein